MTGSDDKDNAACLLRGMLAGIDPEIVCQAVDIPLDHAAATFEIPDLTACGTGVTPAGFLRVTGAFLRHLRAEGCRPALIMPPGRAEGEAACMLEDAYRGMSGAGYHAALLDACGDDVDGLGEALGTVLDETRRRQREKYTRRVLHALCGSMPWRSRQDIVLVFFEHARDVLPQEWATEECARFVNELPRLLLDYAAARAECLRLLYRG